ncbi:MAG: hypothetical protein ACQEQE_11190 [Bacillota bacterium]
MFRNKRMTITKSDLKYVKNKIDFKEFEKLNTLYLQGVNGKEKGFDIIIDKNSYYKIQELLTEKYN